MHFQSNHSNNVFIKFVKVQYIWAPAIVKEHTVCLEMQIYV